MIQEKKNTAGLASDIKKVVEELNTLLIKAKKDNKLKVGLGIHGDKTKDAGLVNLVQVKLKEEKEL